MSIRGAQVPSVREGGREGGCLSVSVRQRVQTPPILHVQKSTICDYLHILLKLVGANDTTRSMAYYLSEILLLHTVFGRWALF